jgi:hypothetical protein
MIIKLAESIKIIRANKMYNSIQAHYDNDDIWERKEDYYNQVVNANGRRMSPHKVIKL